MRAAAFQFARFVRIHKQTERMFLRQNQIGASSHDHAVGFRNFFNYFPLRVKYFFRDSRGRAGAIGKRVPERKKVALHRAVFQNRRHKLFGKIAFFRDFRNQRFIVISNAHGVRKPLAYLSAAAAEFSAYRNDFNHIKSLPAFLYIIRQPAAFVNPCGKIFRKYFSLKNPCGSL